MGLFLLGSAYTDWKYDMDHAPGAIEHSFRELDRGMRSGDYSELNRDLDQSRERGHTETIETVAGVVFLIAGFALWGKSAPVAPSDTERVKGPGLW
jgi:hypothetical protein